jgi:hypothetical protein
MHPAAFLLYDNCNRREFFMDFETLIKSLDNEKAGIRIAALHMLHMVDETRALDAISNRVPVEMDAKVEELLKQVGRNLNKLKREGYDTITAICQNFNVYSDVLTHADTEEFANIQRITLSSQDGRKDRNLDDEVVNAAAILITARLMGPTAVLGSMSTQINLSSNMGSVAETMEKLARRTPATRPTQEDFSRWLPRLKDPNPEERRQALIQISNRNNPLSLQYFAQLWVTDSEESVRASAKRLGKALYWNTVYSQMEADGTLDTIMQEYARGLGLKLNKKTATQEIKIAHSQSLDEIMRRAEERRQKKR